MKLINDPEHGTMLAQPVKSGRAPLHLFENANDIRQTELGSGVMQSSIFVETFENFNKLSGAEIRNIFRGRHILVTNTPTAQPWAWTRSCMQRLAMLDGYAEVQGQ